MEGVIESSRQNPVARFATTHWSVVLRSGNSDSGAGCVAAEALCQAYWKPVYAEVRRRGYGPHAAEDLVQEFFACLMRRESFARADPAKGRFRSFLLGALKHFLADARSHDSAEKRGGGRTFVSLDEAAAECWCGLEPATDETPEKAFDRRWLLELLDRALKSLATEHASEAKARRFAALSVFLAEDGDAAAYERTGERLGMKAGAVAVAIHRLRGRYRELVRAEILQTVDGPEEFEAELKHLLGL